MPSLGISLWQVQQQAHIAMHQVDMHISLWQAQQQAHIAMHQVGMKQRQEAASTTVIPYQSVHML
jgi:hypothetical protein